MERIKNLNKWMKDKTAVKVDESAANCTWFFFKDESILLLEAEAVGHGLYGCIPYEATEKDYNEANKKPEGA